MVKFMDQLHSYIEFMAHPKDYNRYTKDLIKKELQKK